MAKKAHKTSRPQAKREYLKQSDVPIATLNEALRVPEAIFEHYAGRPTSPLQVGRALNLDPKGRQLQDLTGAAIAFGLTEGGAQAAAISVTELATRIVRPKAEGEDLAARREAVLKPRVFGEFLRRYNAHPFPRQDIALNVLEEMGVPRVKAAQVLERIERSAAAVGFLVQIRGKSYVELTLTPGSAPARDEETINEGETGEGEGDRSAKEVVSEEAHRPPLPSQQILPGSGAGGDDARRRKVFITHGKNRGLVDPIKKLLEYGELEPVVSVERESVSKPVPEKVLDDMRGAGAAIIHVEAERMVRDTEGNEHAFLNPNVLIEIGAAMAIYGRRFILLVRDGVNLPSNLQGLYQVRYAGETLDANATIKLLEAMKDIKNYNLPTQSSST
jgi:hypothetical protein